MNFQAKDKTSFATEFHFKNSCTFSLFFLTSIHLMRFHIGFDSVFKEEKFTDCSLLLKFNMLLMLQKQTGQG